MIRLTIGNNTWDIDNNHLFYIAAPYTHTNPDVVQFRIRSVNAFCADLFAKGVHLFSPLSMCHPIAMSHNLPTDALYWHAYNRKMCNLCSHLVVLMLPGWQESLGVQCEIDLFFTSKKPIIYV
jgi:hypothetical protein